jgi:hypothetical protein
LTVYENTNDHKANETIDRTKLPIVKRPIGKGKGNNKGNKTLAKKQHNKYNESDNSDSEAENKPKKGKRVPRVIESDSEEEVRSRKIPTRKTTSRTRNTKVIEELSSSGENVLRENNSFEV